ncbi:lytic transglycosylase domain-containing protein, partial [Escherichia coli]
DRNRSHWSTSKTPSYTKSVSWQHHPIALVESNLKKDSIGKNRDKNNNIKSLDYGLMQINQMHIPLLKKRGIIKDERDLLDNPCLNIKIGTEILYNHFGFVE